MKQLILPGGVFCDSSYLLFNQTHGFRSYFGIGTKSSREDSELCIAEGATLYAIRKVVESELNETPPAIVDMN